jgi:hypothetical protein
VASVHVARSRRIDRPRRRRGAESAAAGRRKGGALHRQRHAPHLRFLLRYKSVRNPPYLIQISTSQRKKALLRRRVSARGVQRTEIQESTIEGRGTRHEKPPNRSLTRCQTADLRGGRQGPGAKDAPRRDLSNDTSIAALTREVKILRPKNRRKIDRFRPKFSKSAATMPATRASDERGNESDSQRPGMPGPERTVR